jgi:regulator of cell morphogenesis and NO signaling
MPSDFNQRKINELVDENYVYASVLYHLGIKFYNYSDETLEQVCKEHGLNVDSVIRNLESVAREGQEHGLKLLTYPLDLIIEYLKHTHHLFVKRRLPYLAKIIETLDEGEHYQSICDDLKFVFPLFVEDFIHHIYEEEDNLFGYIINLEKFIDGKLTPGQIYYEMEKYSVRKYAIEHEVHDDEMNGIRRITKNYQTGPHTSLHVNVVFAELQAFERELKTHSRIENEIFFPKAIELERLAVKIFRKKTTLN